MGTVLRQESGPGPVPAASPRDSPQTSPRRGSTTAFDAANLKAPVKRGLLTDNGHAFVARAYLRLPSYSSYSSNRHSMGPFMSSTRLLARRPTRLASFKLPVNSAAR